MRIVLDAEAGARSVNLEVSYSEETVWLTAGYVVEMEYGRDIRVGVCIRPRRWHTGWRLHRGTSSQGSMDTRYFDWKMLRLRLETWERGY